MSLGLESLRILLADDNPHMRAIVVTLLDSFGVRYIREVRDGAEGVDALRDWTADLAVIDFKMAPLDGVEFTRLVRNSTDSRNPYLPIIMMTGHSARSRVEEARDAGVTEFIAKPVTAKTLLNRIYSVVYKPRPFINASNYFGPDRRRRNDLNYAGPFRRASDQSGRGRTLEEIDLDDSLVWEQRVPRR